MKDSWGRDVRIGSIGKCGKIVFSKKAAQTKANWLYKRRGHELRIYPCQICNAWHLTHQIRHEK